MKLKLWFGLLAAPLVVPGFEVIDRADDFLRARQGTKLFFVELRNRAVRLFPDVAGRLRQDQAITIPL